MALLFDNTGAGSLTLKSPASGAYTLVFPTTSGSAGYFLQTDGSGNLSWAAGGSSTMSDGTEASPGLSFGADLDTGFYRPGDNILAISAAGAEVARLSATGLTMTAGNITLTAKPTNDLHAASKSYVDQAGSIIVSEPNTSRVLVQSDSGKYIRTTNVGAVEITVPPQSSVTWDDYAEVHFEQGGTGQITFTAGAGVTINRAAGTNAASAERYTILTLKRTGTDAWSLVGALEPSAAPAASSVSFTPYGNIAATNVQTALQELDDEKLDAGTAASTYLTQANAASSYVELSGDTMTGPLLISGGDSSTPSIAFSSDTDTGIFWNASNRIGFSAGGFNKFNISSSDIEATVPYRGLDGTAGAPAYSFGSDTNTGIYRSGIDTLNFATNGTLGMTLDSTQNLTVVGDVTANSDIRLKSDIVPIINATSVVNQLRGVFYTKGGRPSVGVIAQEVQSVVPQVVHQNNDGMLSVAYGNLVALLIESNKELLARIERLEKQTTEQ